MNIAIVGTGYVGLVTGACLADSGNYVACLDIDQKKIDGLRSSIIPIYEPGLEEMVLRNQSAGRLSFTTDAAEALSNANIVFLAVGTPPAFDGSADLSGLWRVVETMSKTIREQALVVTKSTVPVGTCFKIEKMLLSLTGKRHRVASNPEFLKEGTAIEDFQKPDRVVVGVRCDDDAEILRSIYAPFLRTEKPFIVMSPESSEMTKYVANALLATKISFINEVANICEKVGADIDDVRRGMGHDSRIGFSFLFPGVGYGGSCFPKDVQALAFTARNNGINPLILDSVHETNIMQKRLLFKKINDFFGGDVSGKKVAVWGLAFKPKTDDIREAPSTDLIGELLANGAEVCVHDPEAMKNAAELYGNSISYSKSPEEVAVDADCLAIVTEWQEYRGMDLSGIRTKMKNPVIFDGRNILSKKEMEHLGFIYHCIGKA